MKTTKNTSLLLALAALSAVALSGCTSSDDGAALSATGSNILDMKDFAFAPGTHTVSAGTKVTWTNSDDVVHTVTAEDGSFDSGDIDGGDSWSYTFTAPGTYLYYCKPHASEGSDGHMRGMVGKIIVT